MRTENSIKNIVLSTALTATTALTGFITRTVFIKTLRSEYLGVNGVIDNVLSMLSIAEMGVAAAIGFSLYKPLVSRDARLVSALMSFYRRAYMAIGVVVALAGLVLLPFLTYFIKSPEPIPHLHFIYLMFLTNTVAAYFLVYPQTLIAADQKAYRTVPFAWGFNITSAGAQITMLLLTHNYMAYLLAQLAILMVERYVTNRYIRRLYGWVDFRSREKLEATTLASIKKNVGAIIWQRIGFYCINGTTNLIIAARISFALVGIYSNYVLLISAVRNLLLLVFNGVTPSFGNMIATESKAKCLDKSRILDFMTFWLFGSTSVCLYNLLNPFIELWIGREYVFGQGIVSLILLDYYLTGARFSIYVVKTSAGIYAQDKYVPILQAVINVGLSLLLAEYIGVAGVFLGMIISSYTFPFWYRATIVYKYVFAAPVGQYFLRYGLYFAVVLFNVALTAYICSRCFSGGGWLQLVGRGLCSVLIPNAVVVAIFWRSSEMKGVLLAARRFSSARLKWFVASA